MIRRTLQKINMLQLFKENKYVIKDVPSSPFLFSFPARISKV